MSKQNSSSAIKKESKPVVNRRRFLRSTGSIAALSSISGVTTAQEAHTNDPNSRFQFTSFPDLFNWDIPYPQPGWDEAVGWFLERMKTEGPAFSLVAGDIMDARWWKNKDQVRHYANAYWGGWMRRVRDHDISVYVAPGDHERGDNPWPEWKLDLVPAFEEKFVQLIDMPCNGPAYKRGLAYHFVRENTLFVSVDTFEVKNGEAHLTVTGEQLDWFENVLSKYQDKDHIIVQGHVPVIPDVHSRASSALVLEEGQDSAFWQTMKKYGVDAYLCGEHHAITVTQEDDIWQIVHGALWGTVSPVNYLVGSVGPETLELELKQFPLQYGGGRIWQRNRPPDNRPWKEVTIPDDIKRNGPESIGRLVLGSRTDENQTKECTGVFKPSVHVTYENAY